MNNGNEPAFPGIEGMYHVKGLTKREHLAAMAMQGILASDHNNEYGEINVTQWAVSMADALLSELGKEKGGK